jgi:hypothetical protein
VTSLTGTCVSREARSDATMLTTSAVHGDRAYRLGLRDEHRERATQHLQSTNGVADPPALDSTRIRCRTHTGTAPTPHPRAIPPGRRVSAP